MSRIPVTLRAASPDDAPALALLWHDVLRRGPADQQVADVRVVLDRVALDPDEAVLVAEYDGHVAGVVHLEVTVMTPLCLEPVVRALSPHVLPEYRRHGVGSALVEAAVRLAEERGIAHISSAAAADSRDANRFMARLALAPLATLRTAPTQAVRAKLPVSRPAVARSSNRHIDRVLAARRGTRRERVTG